MRHIYLVLFVPIAVASCVQPPARAPQPRPALPTIRSAPALPVAPVASWADRAPAPGVWTYARDGRGSIARFGPAGSTALFTIRCAATGARIFVSRLSGSPRGTAAARMTLRSTHGAKTYDALPSVDAPAYAAAEVTARDPQLDAMAFSRGRIMIGLDGANDLVMPIWPEFTRVVEDCRG